MHLGVTFSDDFNTKMEIRMERQGSGMTLAEFMSGVPLGKFSDLGN